MQTITAAARDWIVQRHIQVVAAEEPFKCPACLLPPAFVGRDPVGLQAGRNHRLGFHRLLIESGTFPTTGEETIRTDWDEVLTFGVRALQIGEPDQGLKGRVLHIGASQ